MRNIIAICLVFFIASLYAADTGKPGVVDFRKHNFQSDAVVDLNCQWAVFPNQLLSTYEVRNAPTEPRFVNFSSDWSDIPGFEFEGIYEWGVATYYLQLWLPERFPPLALKVNEINTAHRLVINGRVKHEAGRVGATASTTEPNWEEYGRPIDLQPGLNEIVLQVSNFHHHAGGDFEPMSLGLQEDIMFKEDLEIGSYLFLAGCLIVSGLFGLGLFWFRTAEKSGLYFTFFCFAYAYWILHFDHRIIYLLFQDITWAWQLRFEYMSFSLMVIFFAAFLRHTLAEMLRPFFFYLPGVLSGMMLVLCFILTTPALTLMAEVAYIFIACWFLISAFFAIPQSDFSHKLTWVNLVGVIALSAVFVHRLLVKQHWVNEFSYIDILGNLTFILSQVVANAIRFGRSYRESSLAALAAARTRDEFLNTISHEFKTPMNAILGMATFLENSDLNKSQREKLWAIKRNGESLMNLINDVLSISQVGTGELKLRTQAIDLRECVESAVSLSKQHMKKERVNFKLMVDPDLPAQVQGDPSRIKQILLHLLTNAFKFTDEGEVILKVDRQDDDEDNHNIWFEVSDTGAGISKSYQKKIFGLFRQANGGNARRHQGLGLGLAVVHELVAMMGGRLHIDSQKGQGTTVRFNMRLEPSGGADSSLTNIFQRNEIDRSLTILYAEDNPVNQKLLEMMLKNLGLKIDLAENGRVALEMARKKYYNIIFMDIQMPEMDGIEATRHILDECDSRPIIIAITANLAEVDRQRCFEAGMNDFMAKPVKQEELKLAIIKWQGLKKYLDDSNGKSFKLSS